MFILNICQNEMARCHVCNISKHWKHFVEGSLLNKNRNTHLRCKDCLLCPGCNKLKNANKFSGQSKTCAACCKLWTCCWEFVQKNLTRGGGMRRAQRVEVNMQCIHSIISPWMTPPGPTCNPGIPRAHQYMCRGSWIPWVLDPYHKKTPKNTFNKKH